MATQHAIRIAAGATIALLAHSTSVTAQYAGWLNEIDFDQLNVSYTGLATGANVPVTLVESYGTRTVNDDPTTPTAGDSISYNFYNLDTSQGYFAGKTIAHKGPALTTRYFRDGVTPFQLSGNSVQTSQSSAHANVVGAMFFGTPPGGYSQRSVAPGISNIEVYDYSWNGAYFLAPGTVVPNVSSNLSRVATHAYAQGASLNVNKRMDWVVAADDYLQVVGHPGLSQHGQGYNSIAVAPSAGVSPGTGTSFQDGVYGAGRYKPDITGPHGTTSDSIGAVGGVSALLVSLGRSNTALSNHSYSARPGYTVRSAETSEVVKAALMAGALRHTTGNSFSGNISDYRSLASNQTANGMDKRFGAGKVNVYQSYTILLAGETNSHQDGVGATGQASGIGQYGFDYDPSFGGASGSNSIGEYGFTAGGSGKFVASLVWNVKLGGVGAFNNFDSTATLYNLDLALTDLTTGTMTQYSASTVDSTEHIWADLVGGNRYKLTVSTPGSPFEWDYGLAWRSEVSLTPTAIPEPAALGGLCAGAAVLFTRRRRG